MSELYTNEEAFGGEWSGWGYEMTIKLKEDSTKVEELVENMKKDTPYLITDMKRVKSYL